jgi:predicted membrane channel-forming protein YqfA (hemolysin III family)
MALTYKQRRRWSLLLLLVFLPVYIFVAVLVMSIASRAPIAIELLIYLVLGVAWVFPFKRIFMGIGQVDPDAPDDQV